MNKRIVLQFCLIALIIGFCFPVCAEQEVLTAFVTADFDSNSFSITATAPEGYRECTMLVLKPGRQLPVSGADFESGVVRADYFEITDKEFSFTFKLKSDAIVGNYGFYFTAANNDDEIVKLTHCDGSTYNFGSDFKDQLILDFNSATESDIDDVINKYTVTNPVLKLDTDYYDINKGIVHSNILNYEESFSSIKEIQTLTSESILIIALNDVEEEKFSEKLEEYASTLGITIDSDYTAGKSEIVKRLCEYRKESGFQTVEAIREQYDIALMMSGFNLSTRENIGELLELYKDDLSLNMTNDYYSNKADVHKLMMGGGYYDTPETIKSRFTNAVAEATAADNNNRKPSGGGGGGRGTGIAAPQVQYTKEASADEQKEDITDDIEDSATVVFDDVDSSFWGYNSIMRMYNRKVIDGIGNNLFAPDMPVKREEYVKILAVALGLELPENGKFFDDMEPGKWYCPYIAALYERGILSGIDENRFGIGVQLSRQDAAVLLDRAIRRLNLKTEIVRNTPAFSDYISDYARESVWRLYQIGIIDGLSQTEFGAQQGLTRAQAVKLVDSLLAVQ